MPVPLAPAEELSGADQPLGYAGRPNTRPLAPAEELSGASEGYGRNLTLVIDASIGQPALASTPLSAGMFDPL